LFRDNLTRLYGMKDELEKSYRTQIELVHSRYRGTIIIIHRVPQKLCEIVFVRISSRFHQQ